MNEQRYVIVTVEDAQRIAKALGHALPLGHLDSVAEGVDPDPARDVFAVQAEREASPLARIGRRLATETGAPMQEIVDLLKRTDHCAACHIEGQASQCMRPEVVKKAGRRLRRLLERARGERL